MQVIIILVIYTVHQKDPSFFLPETEDDEDLANNSALKQQKLKNVYAPELAAQANPLTSQISGYSQQNQSQLSSLEVDQGGLAQVKAIYNDNLVGGNRST